jgi:hypothetical protein
MGERKRIVIERVETGVVWGRRNGKERGETEGSEGRKGSQGNGGETEYSCKGKRVRGKGKRRVRGHAERTGREGEGGNRSFLREGIFRQRESMGKRERE